MTAPRHSAGVVPESRRKPAPPETLHREGSKAHKAQQRHLDEELRARLKPGDVFKPAADYGPGHVFGADAELQTEHGPVRCSLDAASSDGSGGHHWCYMRFTGTPDPRPRSDGWR